MLGHFSCFVLASADFFSKSTFFENSFRISIRVSNNMNPDQDRHFVGPDQGPNCLQRLGCQQTTLVGKELKITLKSASQMQ